ncbi:MAG: hypothetical protein LAT82_04970 [Nanoarchaeota archaeon]|nr:hypothetical protein [Nanoarchaeota archaeon]
MKVIQIISFIAVLLLTVSFANASFAGHKSENFQIIHTSIQDCDEEVTVITHNTPKSECYECEFKTYQEPEHIKPTTNVRQVIIEEVQKKPVQKQIETVGVNVKFDDNICDELCEKSFKAPQYSNPQNVEKKSIVTRIMNFVYDCITW